MTAGKICIIIKNRKVVFTVYLHLKELRESLGMTQEEFGKSIGIAKSTYNNYEKGIREPKSDFWIAVAKKYGVTIDYLMGFSDSPHKAAAEGQIRVQKPNLNVGDTYFNGAVRVIQSDVESEHARISLEIDDKKMSADELMALMSAVETISGHSGVSVEGLALLAEAASRAAQLPTSIPQTSPAPAGGTTDTTPTADGPETPTEGPQEGK